MNIPTLEVLNEAVSIRSEMETLEARLASLFSDAPTRTASTTLAPPRPATARRPRKSGSNITPEGRARLAAAMKARWAARRAGAAAPNSAKRRR